MMSSNRYTDFCCSDCNKYFESASFLMTHFALHVNQDIKNDEINPTTTTTTQGDNNKIFVCFKSEKTIPDLYPINMPPRSGGGDEQTHETEEFNPIKFCSITMEVKNQKKKYPCTFCTKVFGWSTDLKRHILTHTGQRPFKCKLCDATFTRNFLLQKHENKTHLLQLQDVGMKMPNLKPLKSRKQDKEKIKRKCFYENKLPQFNVIVDQETIVQ